MSENSTILIPDISGYTSFMSQSELEHNAFILSNLIESIIEHNDLNFTVSEVEGDAVLLYKIGPPVDWKQLINHCLELHDVFHHQLIEMERKATCKCAACKELIKLNLKFVIHYGKIKEVQISQFKKAQGMDMIIAHRLLKNSIDTDDYILASKDYLNHFNKQKDDLGLEWIQSNETYPNVGQVDFEYAVISSGESFQSLSR